MWAAANHDRNRSERQGAAVPLCHTSSAATQVRWGAWKRLMESQGLNSSRSVESVTNQQSVPGPFGTGRDWKVLAVRSTKKTK